jgi:putative SOS response-associated peptidase YedK
MMASAGVLGQQPQTLVTGFGPLLYRVPGLQEGELFAFAGIWDRWKDPNGKTVETRSILTTTANAVTSPVHDRMPVILDPNSYYRWLDPG